MEQSFVKNIMQVCREVAAIAKDLPEGKQRAISNKLSKVVSFSKKAARRYGVNSSAFPHSSEPCNTADQIAQRYVAKQAILDAMLAGRELTFLDADEFGVSEMHTQMHCIRRDIQKKGLPYVLNAETVEFAPGKRCKRYSISPLT